VLVGQLDLSSVMEIGSFVQPVESVGAARRLLKGTGSLWQFQSVPVPGVGADWLLGEPFLRCVAQERLPSNQPQERLPTMIRSLQQFSVLRSSLFTPTWGLPVCTFIQVWRITNVTPP
jgi:hypothetical protein